MQIKEQKDKFKKGFVEGLGWSFGVTIGFVFISILIAFILQVMGGLPLIGEWIAKIVEETQLQLLKRSPLYP